MRKMRIAVLTLVLALSLSAGASASMLGAAGGLSGAGSGYDLVAP